MDSEFKPEPSDFSRCPRIWWFLRRVGIGAVIVFYCYIALMFLYWQTLPFDVARKLARDPRTLAGLSTNDPATVLSTNQQVMPEDTTTSGSLLIRLLNEIILALIPTPLFQIATFGFIGGVFVLIRTFVSTSNRKADMPVSWYVSRPLLAVLIAVFMYFAFVAGHLVFYKSNETHAREAVNTYTLSILAVIAGMFTERAYGFLRLLAAKIMRIEQKTGDAV